MAARHGNAFTDYLCGELRAMGYTSTSMDDAGLRNAWLAVGGEGVGADFSGDELRAIIGRYERHHGLGDRLEPVYAFVYGSLKRGGRLNVALTGLRASFMGDATVQGYTLHEAAGGAFPAAREAAGKQVRGELWLLPSEAGLHWLDRVEGVAMGMYARRLVGATRHEPDGRLTTLWATMYVATLPALLDGPEVGEFWDLTTATDVLTANTNTHTRNG